MTGLTGRRESCPDNLVARSGRGVLSLVEQRALDAHLGLCSSCRATVALRNLFEQLPDLPSGNDAAAVARLAGKVAFRGSRTRDTARPLAFAAGAALMVLAGAAAAWIVLQRSPTVTRTRELPRQRADLPPTQVTAPGLAPESPAAVPRAPAPTPTARKRAVEASHLRGTGADARDAVIGDRPGPSELADEASQLFAAANAARGTRNLRMAARRYDLLEHRYPASPEAAVSLVSAGDVLMRLGEPAAALEHFDRYLATNGRGALALEALLGRARSLRDLGRQPEELETWRELLRRFPGSLYEASARRRVDELAR